MPNNKKQNPQYPCLDRLEMIRRRCRAADNDFAVENLHLTAIEDIFFLLHEINRLRAVENEYHRLLLSHLRVMKRDGDLYQAGGTKASADLMRRMAELGLFEIAVNGPENHIIGRLTPEGKRIMGGEV